MEKRPKWKFRWTPIPEIACGPWEKWELGGTIVFYYYIREYYVWVSFAVWFSVSLFTDYDMDEGPIHSELVEKLVF